MDGKPSALHNSQQQVCLASASPSWINLTSLSPSPSAVGHKQEHLHKETAPIFFSVDTVHEFELGESSSQTARSGDHSKEMLFRHQREQNES